MNFLNVFEYFKERRYAALFVVSMFLCFGLLLLACGVGDLLRKQGLAENAIYILPGLGIFFAAWVWWIIRLFRAHRNNLYKPSPMSRDELHKARSKLVKAKE